MPRRRYNKVCIDCDFEFSTKDKRESICQSCSAEQEQKVFDKIHEEDMKGGDKKCKT